MYWHHSIYLFIFCTKSLRVLFVYNFRGCCNIINCLSITQNALYIIVTNIYYYYFFIVNYVIIIINIYSGNCKRTSMMNCIVCRRHAGRQCLYGVAELRKFLSVSNSTLSWILKKKKKTDGLVWKRRSPPSFAVGLFVGIYRPGSTSRRFRNTNKNAVR